MLALCSRELWPTPESGAPIGCGRVVADALGDEAAIPASFDKVLSIGRDGRIAVLGDGPGVAVVVKLAAVVSGWDTTFARTTRPAPASAKAAAAIASLIPNDDRVGTVGSALGVICKVCDRTMGDGVIAEGAVRVGPGNPPELCAAIPPEACALG
mgnify:FL=1